MDEDRRAADGTFDGAYALAILYTFGYLAMVGLLMFFDIPENNREILLSLIGIMSAAQLGIIKYFYDGSKGAEKAQNANIVRASKTDAVVQEIAKTAPQVAAAAVAASGTAGAGTPAKPLQTDQLNVNAANATVTEVPSTNEGEVKP